MIAVFEIFVDFVLISKGGGDFLILVIFDRFQTASDVQQVVLDRFKCCFVFCGVFVQHSMVQIPNRAIQASDNLVYNTLVLTRIADGDIGELALATLVAQRQSYKTGSFSCCLLPTVELS